MSSTAPQPDAVQLWRRYAAQKKQDSTATPLSIGLAGSFTVDPLVPYLGGMLLAQGVEAPNLTVGPYNQIYQLCFNCAATLGREHVDALIILWRIEDIIPDLVNEALAGKAQAVTSLFEELANLLKAIKTLRNRFNGTLIVSTPPYPSLPSFDAHELEQPTTGVMLYKNILQRWVEGLSEIGRIKILDLHGLLSQAGYAASYDIRKWYLYKQPYTETCWSSIGRQLARIMAAQTISAKKCVVLDCDNTLWGGIVGEDGLSGIELGYDFPGSAFRDFQKHLLHLRNKGVFLAVASKNNEEDVFDVFDKHDAMVLSRDHVSVFEVHWNSKVESLRNIAATLNIGLDALVFVDDNPKEIAEVNERLPEVTCLLVPEETAYLPNLLRNTSLFDIAEITAEDRQRVDMMMLEQKRMQVRQEQSEEDFLQSLELKISVFEAESKHIARVTQLINKTNQFNLTTIRRSQDEIEALVTASDTRVFAMEVADRFGEYGLVGVAIIKQANAEEWLIDTLLMSCRVLGRGAETAFIGTIAKAVKLYGGNRLRGEYRATGKNALVKDLYQNHGFIPDENNAQWLGSVDGVPQPPDYVNVSLKLLD